MAGRILPEGRAACTEIASALKVAFATRSSLDAYRYCDIDRSAQHPARCRQSVGEVDKNMENVTPGAVSLGLFIRAALVLLLIPGPAVSLGVQLSAAGSLALSVFLGFTRQRSYMSPQPPWDCHPCLPRRLWPSVWSST